MNNPSSDQIVSTIASILEIKPATLTPSTPLSSLSLDSFDYLSLSFSLEEHFFVPISSSDFYSFTTIQSIITHIQSHER